MKRSLLAAGLLMLAMTTAQSRYIRPDLEKIPVDRLVANLKAKSDMEPKNAQARFNLARAHGMAYARKSAEMEIFRGKADNGPWFGYEPAFVPFGKPVEAKDKEAEKAARGHLQAAIEQFGKAMELQPDNLAAELGKAWCVEQSGDKTAAIGLYRKVVEKGWAKDQKAEVAPLGGHFITAEAAGYLIPLLDKDKDAKEIETLQGRVTGLGKLPRPITPIAVPLADGLDASDILDAKAAVGFDADGTGLPGRWTWINSRAAWLVMDHKGDGKVRSGLQLFGSVSFWMFWENGYDALAALDDNHDGELSGRELAGLSLWHDANGNGVSEPGEVRPVGSHGIVAISCRGNKTAQDALCAARAAAGIRLANGATRPTFDLILNRK